MASNEGVTSVEMNIQTGLVKISGESNFDPSIFVKTIAKTGKKAQFPATENSAPAPTPTATPIGQNPQFPTRENMTSAPAATSDNASGHHVRNKNSINSNNHCCKSERTTHYGNSDAGNFSDHRSRSDKVHINEAAAVNPPVPLPLPNRMFMRPPMSSPRLPPPPQYGDMSFRGSHGFWPGMSEPWSSASPPPPPMTAMAPPHSYYRWPEPVPYYLQEQQPPVGNTPSHYLFNDENTEGCVII
ncbi:hypothetical protein E6C27_scaffold497G00730 [Cucumis melo var. makuwa]|uniref:HMA domain-containing protein n=3 Tax=Cucumis melo TaxID=3656 RepID=A0A5A7UTY4_CUCMM|nr:hypothetical protein E6C27_scaffold497G00730 [Cucumis melo var. makuwa]